MGTSPDLASYVPRHSTFLHREVNRQNRYNEIMDHRIDILRPRCILFSWLCAAASFSAALVIAAFGQGLGGIIGGCEWIGMSVPLNRQVWALMNQPSINFADTAAAHGYWLGSLIVPFVIVVVLMFGVRRARSVAYEILAVQLSWALIILCLAWPIALAPAESHLGKWLHFNGISMHFAWAMPSLAVLLGLLPTLRLLMVLRQWRRHASALVRVITLLIHLAIPTAGWLTLSFYLDPAVNMIAIVVLAFILFVALIVAWFRYPEQPYRPLDAISFLNLVVVVFGTGLLFFVLWFAGRPLEDQASSGLLWGQRSTTNNIRPWITPRTLFLDRKESPESPVD